MTQTGRTQTWSAHDEWDTVEGGGGGEEKKGKGRKKRSSGSSSKILLGCIMALSLVYKFYVSVYEPWL